jgi:hypothetical protein
MTHRVSIIIFTLLSLEFIVTIKPIKSIALENKTNKEGIFVMSIIVL